MEDNGLQLRSEKTRKIIGRIPSRIIRYGTVVVSCILVMIFVFSLIIKSPQYLHCQVQMIGDTAYISVERLDEIDLIQAGQTIKFYESDESIYGIIKSINSAETKFDGKKYIKQYEVEIKGRVPVNVSNIVFSSTPLEAKIRYSEETLFDIIIN